MREEITMNDKMRMQPFGLPDPRNDVYTWQLSTMFKDNTSMASFLNRPGQLCDEIDRHIKNKRAKVLIVFHRGQLYEIYQLLMSNQWMKSNFQTHEVDIGTPEEIMVIRDLGGFPI